MRRWHGPVLLLLVLLGLGGSARAQDLAAVLEPKIEGPVSKEQQQRLMAAVTEALRSVQLQTVPAADLSAVLDGEPELSGCRTDECLDRLGRLLTAQSILSLTFQHQPATGGPSASASVWHFSVSLFNVPIGAVGFKETQECGGCDAEQGAAALGELVKKAVLLDAAQPRGLIEVTSDPSGDVLVDGRKLGFTPYKRKAFVGKHEISVVRTGYKTFRSTITVEPSKKEAVYAKLQVGSDKTIVEVRGQRPRWRLAAGIAGIGVGAIVAGFGISALVVNGSDIGQPVAPMQFTKQVYTTGGIGGALVGVGAVLVAAGVVVIALPGEKHLVEMSAGLLGSGPGAHLALSF